MPAYYLQFIFSCAYMSKECFTSHSICWLIFTDSSICFGTEETLSDPSETELHSLALCSFSCVRVWNDGTPIKLLLLTLVLLLDGSWCHWDRVNSFQSNHYSALHNHGQKSVKIFRHSDGHTRALLNARGWRSGPFTDENRASGPNDDNERFWFHLMRLN